MGSDFLSMMDETLGGFGLADLKFLVVDVTPAKMPVLIGPDTEIIYNPEAVEVSDEGTMVEVSTDAAVEVSYPPRIVAPAPETVTYAPKF